MTNANANAWIKISREMNLRKFTNEHAVATMLMMFVIVASGLVELALPAVVLARALGLALTGLGLGQVIVVAIAAHLATNYAIRLCVAILEQAARG